MKKIISGLFLGILMSHVAFASTATAKEGVDFFALGNSPNGEEVGSLGGQTSSDDLPATMYQCWARTLCRDGREISCSSSGSESCYWEFRQAEYVLCQSRNLDGSGNQIHITCPN